MEIYETEEGGSIVLHIAGRVNSVNAPKLSERLTARLQPGCRPMLVDLSRLDHMTSAGFRALLIAERQTHAMGATMVIYGLEGLTFELFEIGGFLEMFTVVASREEALRRASAAQSGN